MLPCTFRLGVDVPGTQASHSLSYGHPMPNLQATGCPRPGHRKPNHRRVTRHFRSGDASTPPPFLTLSSPSLDSEMSSRGDSLCPPPPRYPALPKTTRPPSSALPGRGIPPSVALPKSTAWRPVGGLSRPARALREAPTAPIPPETPTAGTLRLLKSLGLYSFRWPSGPTQAPSRPVWKPRQSQAHAPGA